MLYVFETMNESAIGPFASRDAAEAWLVKVVPPEDRDGAPENKVSDISGEGYRIGTLAEVNDQLSSPQFETPTAAEARLRVETRGAQAPA